MNNEDRDKEKGKKERSQHNPRQIDKQTRRQKKDVNIQEVRQTER